MNRIIRVAYLDYSEVFAGAEQVLHTIISGLDRTRFEPILVFPYPRAHQCRYDDLDCKKIFLADGVKWWMGHYRWKHPVRGTDFLARTIWGFKLAMLLKRRDVDILHINLLRPDCMMWVLPVKKLTNVKVIGHYRSQEYEWVPMPRVQCLLNRVLCVSHFSRSHFLHRGEHVPSQVLYDSINLSKFNTDIPQAEARHRLGLPEDGMLISSVGQLSKHKGHDTAIRIFAILSKRFSNLRLYIAGIGVWQKELHQMAVESGVSDRIIFSDCQVSDMSAVYRASDLILSLTKVGEGFGLVPYEAAVHSTPFVAPEFGAVTEFVTDGVSGLLVDTNDDNAVAAKVEWALLHLDEAKQMMTVTKEIISSQLTPNVMCHNLAEVYKRCL